MKVRIVITAELGELWATPEEFAERSDQQIRELVMEDVDTLLEDAQWRVERQ